MAGRLCKRRNVAKNTAMQKMTVHLTRKSRCHMSGPKEYQVCMAVNVSQNADAFAFALVDDGRGGTRPRMVASAGVTCRFWTENLFGTPLVDSALSGTATTAFFRSTTTIYHSRQFHCSTPKTLEKTHRKNSCTQEFEFETHQKCLSRREPHL